MPVLIVDCYNLLRAPMPPSLAGLEEGRLCELLARWRERTAAAGRIVVVCDGGFKPGLPRGSSADGVELIYAGAGRKADPLIQSLIDADTTPRQLLLVSTDRQLQRAARRRGGRAVDSAMFVYQLAAVAAGRSAGSRAAGPDKPDLDMGAMSEESVRRWAEVFGLDPARPLGDDEPPRPPRKKQR